MGGEYARKRLYLHLYLTTALIERRTRFFVSSSNEFAQELGLKVARGDDSLIPRAAVSIEREQVHVYT